MAIKKVLLAKPRGFCAGFELIEIVERALDLFPSMYFTKLSTIAMW
jgi:4-hydroxy-3-methylbut-2-enyl diphosphate reductase IspH